MGLAGGAGGRIFPVVIRVGISAWTEPTLVRAGWYPEDVNDAESRLRWYATQFPLVEVDSTYYALPPRRNAELWVERTPDHFVFDVKAFALLTEHYTDPKRLPKDLRGVLPEELRRKRNVYARDVGNAFIRECARRFREALEPLHDAGKLGVVLFQYPVWFPFSRENLAKLDTLRFLLPDYRIAVELRNESWFRPGLRTETLAALRANDLAYVCVDEPQGFTSSVPPLAVATSDLAVVRFHGRAAHVWTKKVPTAADRFAYLYSDEELAAWVPAIARLDAHADEVHVIMNNCHADFAVRNAAMLSRQLRGEGQMVEAPGP